MSNFNELENLYNKKRYDDLEIKTKKLIENNPNIAALYNILGMAFKEQIHVIKLATKFILNLKLFFIRLLV